eukprot:Unigene12705_Nuclearia_a/m.38597 Unigene12705_Nuclearia_a/g.38597  ORF Unigene12705_Nuclearia_a/g.38597 Unigene12705_Nuclearia_a/m.38597 type:complete len:221 (-) Unigene12705_Nuclearia_a:1001-1663(-)
MEAPAVLTAVVVGAGPSGICAAVRLREAARVDDFVVVEKNANLSGTWWDNQYPGCGCDVASHLYSFSFELNSGTDVRRDAAAPLMHRAQNGPSSTRSSPRSWATLSGWRSSTACASASGSTPRQSRSSGSRTGRCGRGRRGIPRRVRRAWCWRGSWSAASAACTSRATRRSPTLISSRAARCIRRGGTTRSTWQARTWRSWATRRAAFRSRRRYNRSSSS